MEHRSVAASIEQSAVVEQLRSELRMTFVSHRPHSMLSASPAVVADTALFGPDCLVERVVSAYRAAAETDLGSASIWIHTIADLKRGVHDLLMHGDLASAREMFRDPRRSTLFYGFDTLSSDNEHSVNPGMVQLYSTWTHDNLVRLAEAVGVVPLHYPEAPPDAAAKPQMDVETLLGLLDKEFGFRIDFPNPFDGEYGLSTSRGTASYRSVQALYQAWIAWKASRGGRVLEIGGRLGRTAYYALKFGVREYTIVDLPMTGAAQAYFLGTVGQAIQLYGEQASIGLPRPVKLLPPSAFFASDDTYDLILNVDSFTEMGEDTARHYAQAAVWRCPLLISINHEYNPFRMRDILSLLPRRRRVTREPYWLRNGYVQETVEFE